MAKRCDFKGVGNEIIIDGIILHLDLWIHKSTCDKMAENYTHPFYQCNFLVLIL